ncbi:MAG: bacteriochlorophyll c synthase [[Chlorobium] sp. 445]|nr:MAG: bacteriochlorophyll c synthase [[Chlorobium] sp. 445]
MSKPATLPLREKLKAHLELLDPITWVGVLQGIVCGAIASGALTFNLESLGKFGLLTLLFGPLGTGFAQSLNDYFDRDLDRVNEPTRPIPSGRLTEREALWNWIIVGIITLGVGILLGSLLEPDRGLMLIGLTILGLIMGYIYSAPPIKLKTNVLLSAPSVGLTYSFITWIAGNIIYADLRPEVLAMAIINALVAIGLIFLNDFKSIEGDRAQGLKSLPVMIGVRNTYLVSFLIIDLPLIWFVYLMKAWGFDIMFFFSLISLLIIIAMQIALYRDPEDGAKALDAAIQQTGLKNVVGQSETKAHRSYLRYLVVNNGLYVLNVFAASFFIAQKPLA